jgi:hypothetical protein
MASATISARYQMIFLGFRSLFSRGCRVGAERLGGHDGSQEVRHHLGG